MISDYHRYRLYEILPGLSIWLTLFLGIFLSFVKPLWIIYFIILFDIYWVLKIFNFSFYLLVAWRRMSITLKTDWFGKLKEIRGWEEKEHLVFLTVFNEEWGVVKTAISSVADAVYDKKKFTLVVAGEERKKEHCLEIIEKTKAEFGDKFEKIIGTIHPKDLPGEIPGKGSNLHYAERQVKEYVDKKGWKYKDVIVTVFDIDTVCHREYFNYLTYLYCTHKNPTRTSFQPVALYNNNMWESPSVLRVMAFGTTFWLTMASTK